MQLATESICKKILFAKISNFTRLRTNRVELTGITISNGDRMATWRTSDEGEWRTGSNSVNRDILFSIDEVWTYLRE